MSRRTRQQNRDRDERAARRNNIVYDNGETWEQYIERCEVEGYDLDMTGIDDPDPYVELLSQYPVTHQNWIDFFENYFNWIYDNFNDCLVYSGNTARTFDDLMYVPFVNGGFDLIFHQNYDQASLARNVELYNNLLQNFMTCVEQQAMLSGRNKDVLINYCRAIANLIADYRVTGEANERNGVENPYNDFYGFYGSMIVFMELSMNHNVFYAYITGDNTGRTRRVPNYHPEYYRGIWIRKSSVWGIGDPQFDHNGVRFLIGNYARELLTYARNNNRQQYLFNVNLRFYQPIVGGASQNVSSITSLIKTFPKNSKSSSSGAKYIKKDNIRNDKEIKKDIKIVKSQLPVKKYNKDLQKIYEFVETNLASIKIKFKNKTMYKKLLLPLPPAYHKSPYDTEVLINLPIFGVYIEPTPLKVIKYHT
tara:strand:+ start:19799 stop:21061 length:1263 start_codon:yes stop_codon:yes gene_type:complete